MRARCTRWRRCRLVPTPTQSAYTRAAEVARADGYPGVAAIYLAYSVSSALLGGGGIQEATATAEESVALARRSGMPAAIVLSLNAVALTLVEPDPARARAVLRESIERSRYAGRGGLVGSRHRRLVAGRLRDWDLTLALAARTMHLCRWRHVPLAAATCLAECARALAEDRPEVAGVLRGAAYAAFRRASPAADGTRRSEPGPAIPAPTSFSRPCARPVTSSAPRSATSADASFVPRARRWAWTKRSPMRSPTSIRNSSPVPSPSLEPGT